MADPTPLSINQRGVITAVDADGITHRYHTDPVESRQFALASMCLAAGRDELFLLLYSNDCPQYAAQRHVDGRSDEELKADWLAKVCRAGMPKPAALAFLEARLA